MVYTRYLNGADSTTQCRMRCRKLFLRLLKTFRWLRNSTHFQIRKIQFPVPPNNSTTMPSILKRRSKTRFRVNILKYLFYTIPISVVWRCTSNLTRAFVTAVHILFNIILIFIRTSQTWSITLRFPSKKTRVYKRYIFLPLFSKVLIPVQCSSTTQIFI